MEHEFFKKLAGNPQSIILMASMISENKKNLQELFELLKSNPSALMEMKSTEVNTALLMSLHVTTSELLKEDAKTLKLFFMICLLPDNIKI